MLLHFLCLLLCHEPLLCFNKSSPLLLYLIHFSFLRNVLGSFSFRFPICGIVFLIILTGVLFRQNEPNAETIRNEDLPCGRSVQSRILRKSLFRLHEHKQCFTYGEFVY